MIISMSSLVMSSYSVSRLLSQTDCSSYSGEQVYYNKDDSSYSAYFVDHNGSNTSFTKYAYRDLRPTKGNTEVSVGTIWWEIVTLDLGTPKLRQYTKIHITDGKNVAVFVSTSTFIYKTNRETGVNSGAQIFYKISDNGGRWECTKESSITYDDDERVLHML